MPAAPLGTSGSDTEEWSHQLWEELQAHLSGNGHLLLLPQLAFSLDVDWGPHVNRVCDTRVESIRTFAAEIILRLMQDSLASILQLCVKSVSAG